MNLWVQDASRTALAGTQKPERASLMLQSPLNTEKNTLRKLLRHRRIAVSAAERGQAEWQAALQARKQGLLRPGQRIAAYVPVGSEFSAWPLILHALKLGVEVYLPQIPKHGRKLAFVRFDQDSVWKSAPGGIPEPMHRQCCKPQKLHTVFMPLLGFDAEGRRLGQGGGYYDATFAFRRVRRHWLQPKLIGLAFACQQVDQLPVEPWDVKLDRVLTGE